jgi:predicted DNA-binding transcriptional regulator YafY
MRYGPGEQLIDVILALSATRSGLSIQDLMARFDVSRSTAERLLKAADRLATLELVYTDDERRKHWRLARPPLALNQVTAEELAAMEVAIEAFQRDGLELQAERLICLQDKIRVSANARQARKLDVDLAVLAEAEGFASRPGPHPDINPEHFDTLSYAIKAARKVRIDYQYRGSGRLGYQTVHPYGFLYGVRHYLVAFSENARAQDVRLYALSNLERVTLLDDPFVPVQGFSLDRFADEMFGVFREEPVEVVWRFSEEVADDVREYRFHPAQQLEALPDGRIEVRFRAGGMLEMAWHLFTWGDAVEIVAPPELRAKLLELLEIATLTHGADPTNEKEG